MSGMEESIYVWFTFPGQNYWFLVEMEGGCEIFILKSFYIETESNSVLKNYMSDNNRVYFSKVRMGEFY